MHATGFGLGCFIRFAVAAAGALAMLVQGVAAQDFQAALQKANAYIEAAKGTERAVDSWERYRSWVNVKKGPTGREEYISYGLYDVPDAESILKEGREAAVAKPAVALDDIMARYFSAYEALAPVLNEAAAYYERNGYESDNAAHGRELHTKLVPLAEAFMAEREAMMSSLRAFVRVVEKQQADAIEKEEGRTARWQAVQIMHAAETVFDVFPRTRPQQMNSEELEEQIKALGPDTPPEKFDEVIAGATASKESIDVKKFAAALETYAAAVEAFSRFKGEKPEGFDELKPLPPRLLEMLRTFQGPLKKSEGREFEGAGQMVAQMYQVYIEMLNASSPLMQSQLRYLP